MPVTTNASASATVFLAPSVDTMTMDNIRTEHIRRARHSSHGEEKRNETRASGAYSPLEPKVFRLSTAVSRGLDGA
jgi:hypothetical protein